MFHCTACKGIFKVAPVGACTCGKWNTVVKGAPKQGKMLEAVGPIAIGKIEGGLKYHRVTTGTDEFDRVLAGGAVMGSVVLVGGPPGKGKSTLLLQMGCELADAPVEPQKVLYISGEETVHQIKGRGGRICPEMSSILLCNETDIDKVIDWILKEDPDVLIVDSIQTMRDEREGGNSPVQQIAVCTKKLVAVTKAREMITFIVAQVNKEGDLAGPKTLEHLVDTVLTFEDENQSSIRVLRATKNRYGDTGEVGIFRMVHGGMESVKDPSEFLLRGKKGPPGSALACMLISPGAGSAKRPMLVEVQCLLSVCGEGAKATRVALGYDPKRLEMIMAVLAKYVPGAELLRAHDVYLNVGGGFKMAAEGLDLPVAMALLSELYRTPLPSGSVFWGELGLQGDVRPEGEYEKRCKVSEAMGMLGVVCSKEKEIVFLEDIAKIIEPSEGSPLWDAKAPADDGSGGDNAFSGDPLDGEDETELSALSS